MRAWISVVLFLLLQGCGGGEEPTPKASSPTDSPPPASAACPSELQSGDLTPSPVSAPQCAAANYDLHTDIPYGTGGEHLLDLLVPRDATTPLPVVVWIHGGGWQSGDKQNREQAERLVCRGYAVASINYRLSSTAIFPAQIHDVKAAIRLLRAHASTYNLDPARMAAMGSSAGGHLAALAGTSGGVAELEDLSLGSGAVSSRVQAVVDWYGPTRLADMDAQLLAQGCPAGSAHHGESDSPESHLLGCTLASPDCADAARRADPATYATAGDPPMLLLHGTEDCVSPVGQSEVLAKALVAAQSCAVMRRVPGAAHGGPAWLSPEVQDATAEFLDRVL